MDTRFCNGMTHIVKQGDTLYQISRLYDVPLGVILRANPYVDVYNLQIGQEICVPIRNWRPEGPRPDRPRPEGPRPDRPRPGDMEAGDMRPEDMWPDNDRIPNDRILYVTNGEISLGELLREYDVDLDDFEDMNDLSQIMLAKDVVLYLPKKV
ncbi:MAG: LysM peptidoglycan-binding domain-containing protein [Lachnospiraceae bacterium]|nr:LysM peptidoglycan-binding domain-containing protein [Lachnospiraceae bacterium]